MARKFSELAKRARERFRFEDTEMSNTTQTTTQTAPPMAKKAKYLRDADGNIYLWTEELAMRGDLVAAYDPDNPDKFGDDQKQIALNRELELARERAEAEEVARLEAIKVKEEAEQARREAEELAAANARNLQLAEQALQKEREENAKALAEMQAKLDAMAKQSVANEVVEEETVEAKPKAKRKTSKKATEVETPEVVAEETTETEPNTDLLDDFDN